MDEDDLSQLIDRFYALGQLSAQMQSIVDEVDYLVDGEGEQYLGRLQAAGAALNAVLEKEAGRLVGFQTLARNVEAMISTMEVVAQKENLQGILFAINQYRGIADETKSAIEDDIDAQGDDNI